MKWGINMAISKSLSDISPSNKVNKKEIAVVNARVETIEQKYPFRELVNNKCVIPLTSYIEWKSEPSKKVPYIFHGENYISVAGIFNEDNEFTMITRNADTEYSHIHDRMPYIIHNFSDYLESKKLNAQKTVLEYSQKK